MGEIEERRSEGGSRKKVGGKGKEKRAEEREDDGSQESGRRIGDLGGRRGGSKIRRGSKEDGT